MLATWNEEKWKNAKQGGIDPQTHHQFISLILIKNIITKETILNHSSGAIDEPIFASISPHY